MMDKRLTAHNLRVEVADLCAEYNQTFTDLKGTKQTVQRILDAHPNLTFIRERLAQLDEHIADTAVRLSAARATQNYLQRHHDVIQGSTLRVLIAPLTTAALSRALSQEIDECAV